MNTSTPKSFWRRIWIYSLEMFPVLIYLPYIIALYVCLNFTTQAMTSHSITIDIYSIVGMISAFFIMLQMRTYDDLKDIDIDKDLFPDRATPRGAVLKSDIVKISIFSFIVLLIVNIGFAPKTLSVFAIMMLYTVLTFKWFFAEKYHREHIFFTMITHQPIPYMINFYLIHTALASGGTYESFTLNHFAILLLFSLPVTAWESSRKIRALGNETDYETFSMVFGCRPATLIPFVSLLITLGISIYIGSNLGFSMSYFVIVILFGLFVVFYYTRFLIYPTIKHNVLKNVAMVFTTALFFTSMVFILFSYDVHFTI